MCVVSRDFNQRRKNISHKFLMDLATGNGGFMRLLLLLEVSGVDAEVLIRSDQLIDQLS